MGRTQFGLLLTIAVALGGTGESRAVELITNGGFETGTLAGWSLHDLGSGTFSIETGMTVPGTLAPTPGPAGGSFYALSHQSGPGTHAIVQSFTVPGPQTSVVLSFHMFVQSLSSAIVDPAGLDHTVLAPNQHARVDILTAGADAFDTGAEVLANLYTGIDGNPIAGVPYTSYTHDITSIVGGGGTFLLRFAEVDNEIFLNQGVDNVSIQAVPEPGSLAALGSLAIVGLLAYRRRQAGRG